MALGDDSTGCVDRIGEVNSQPGSRAGLLAGAARRVEPVDAKLRRQYAGRRAPEEIAPRVREALEGVGVYITGSEKARKYAEAIRQGKPFRLELR